jgi:hypothetical protein
MPIDSKVFPSLAKKPSSSPPSSCDENRRTWCWKYDDDKEECAVKIALFSAVNCWICLVVGVVVDLQVAVIVVA